MVIDSMDSCCLSYTLILCSGPGEVPGDGVHEGLSVLMALGMELGNSERLPVVMASPSPVCPCKVDARPEALDELPTRTCWMLGL